MKKIYISADIEGVCGIADWKETDLKDGESAYFRAQMTREVAAVCRAAGEMGVEEILVKDAHGSGRNLDPSLLPENVRILRAWTGSPLVMMAGLDEDFDAAIFIGYHSGAGSDGHPLAHTMNGRNTRILINGEEASEFLINAYTAASFHVPVVLVSGDRQLCLRAQSLNPNIRTVAVHEGIGGATLSIHPALAVSRISEGVREALKGDLALCRFPLPEHFEIQIDFKEHEWALRGSFYPGATPLGPRSVSFTCSAWLDALRFFTFVL
jgi:D-amino peptidase